MIAKVPYSPEKLFDTAMLRKGISIHGLLKNMIYPSPRTSPGRAIGIVAKNRQNPHSFLMVLPFSIRYANENTSTVPRHAAPKASLRLFTKLITPVP